MLEASCHASNSFVTLTYAVAPQELVPRDTQLWLKRFRKRVSPVKVRYYLCGELGDRTKRPHYHVVLFGIGDKWTHSVVRETWGLGHVSVSPLTLERAQYIAGYVTKKIALRQDIWLHGLLTHFSRCSRDPPVGANALWDVASETMRYSLEPSAGGYAGSVVRPYGRTLRKVLHEYSGSGPPVYEPTDKVRAVQAFAWNSSLSLKKVWEQVNESPEVYKLRGSL